MADFNQALGQGANINADQKKAEQAARNKAARAESLKVWKDAFQATLSETNGAIKDQIKARANDIVVEKALTFGTPNFVKKEGVPDEPIPNIVGYTVRNVSATPIECYTTKCDFDASLGRYIKSAVLTSIAPNGVLALRKADFTTLMSAPEFSFTAKNGKLASKRMSLNVGETTNAQLEEFLEKHNFLFRTEDGKPDLVANHLEAISVKQDGVDVVVEAYHDTFAFLENKKEKAARQPGEKKTPDPSILAANYVRRLISKAQG